MARLLCVLSMLFASAAEAQSGRQALALTVPAAWQIAYEEEAKDQRLVEYQPPGQDIHNYRDMLALWVFSKTLIPDARFYARVTAFSYNDTCPAVVGMEIDAGSTPANMYRFLVVCPSTSVIFTDKQKPGPYGEVAMYTVIEATRVIFVVKRIWRTAPIADVAQLPVSDAELDEEVERHGNGVLCGEQGIATSSRDPAGAACTDLARKELAEFIGKGDQMVVLTEWVP